MLAKPNYRAERKARVRNKNTIAWAQRILTLDHMRCRNRRCENKYGLFGTLDAHHIIYRSQGGQNTIENGITLCRGCHNKVHNGTEIGKERWTGKMLMIAILKQWVGSDVFRWGVALDELESR